ncbi:MAG: M23 family metallopeptidase [Pseudanabaenaceae cyanobacterium]
MDRKFWKLTGLLGAIALGGYPPANACGAGVLSNLQRHEVKAGETLFTIARQYGRQPATLMALNPAVRSGRVRPGQILEIPKVDGLVHRLTDGENYRTVAQRYGVRPDVLFEQNGCEAQPVALFVPGAVWQPEVTVPDLVAAARPRYTATAWQLPTVVFADGYPLPYNVPVTSPFGWRRHPVTGETAFHSGIDLGAPLGTPVLATADGLVDFAGVAGGYGHLVTLTHGDRQTQYAHLDRIAVQVGQRVRRGQVLGTVGATGRVTGPHLHYEVLIPGADGWMAIDPAPSLFRLAQNP